jgi:hypothetical protein
MRLADAKQPLRLFIKAVVLCLLFAALPLPATDKVTFTIFKRVQFMVPGDWVVISSMSGPEKTVFAFQIKNPADKRTSDSTNLVIISYYLQDSAANADYQKRMSPQDEKAEKKELAENWNCSTFSRKQGSTPYEIWDCNRIVSECGVSVRMAWPHLPKNPPDYDARMKTALVDVLDSVTASPK